MEKLGIIIIEFSGYGRHNTQFVNESQILYFEYSKADAIKNSRIGVKIAFEELALKPDVDKEIDKGKLKGLKIPIYIAFWDQLLLLPSLH